MTLCRHCCNLAPLQLFEGTLEGKIPLLSAVQVASGVRQLNFRLRVWILEGCFGTVLGHFGPPPLAQSRGASPPDLPGNLYVRTYERIFRLSTSRQLVFSLDNDAGIRVLVGLYREYRRLGFSYPRFAASGVTLDFCSTYTEILRFVILRFQKSSKPQGFSILFGGCHRCDGAFFAHV